MSLLPFANAPGSGGGGGTVTSVSVTTANGVSGSVANPTTTPAISLTLGAITPSSVNSIVLSGSSTPTLSVTGTSSISGSNTGDQTITLTGDVTGSGTGSFAATIKNNVALGGSPTTTTQSPADNSTKIATTAYVDNAVLGQNFKEAVGAATTANLVGVYLNGSSGVGATFTYTATGVDTIDGVTLTLGMRVLVKNQSTAFQNGLYTVTTAGAIGVAGVLTRATDGDQSTDWKTGDSVFVTAGTTQSTTTWAYTGVDSPAIGTDSLTFVQTAGQGSFTAGNGISITGNSIAIDTSVTVDKTTAQTLTNKTLTAPIISTISNTGTLTLPTSTDTLVGKATTDTFTNKTFDTAGTGNVFKINGTTITDKTGTGKVVLDASPTITGHPTIEGVTSTGATGTGKFVFDGSPTLVTPTIGVATATSINKVTITAPATSSTLTIADGSTLATSGANSITLTSTGATNVTLPTTGTLATLAGSETLTNKALALNTSTLSNPYKFSVYRNAAANTGNAAFAKITFDTEDFDTNNNFATGTYTAPVNGFYQFNWQATAGAATTDIVAALYINGSIYAWGQEERAAGGTGGSTMVSLSANDTVEVYCFGNTTIALGVGTAPKKTWFSGFLVSQT